MVVPVRNRQLMELLMPADTSLSFWHIYFLVIAGARFASLVSNVATVASLDFDVN